MMEPKIKKSLLNHSQKKVAMIIFEVFFIVCAIIFLMPVVLTILNSLKMEKDIQNSVVALPKLTEIVKNILYNYGSAWKQTKFPIVFFNTLIITALSTLGIVFVSSMAAYVMVRTKWKLSWVLFLFFTFAMVVPFQSIMIPLVETAKVLNLKNTIQGIILIYIGVGAPMAIFMYHGFIKGVPKELEESALIDGASKFTIFFKIVFPLLTPITATIVILDVLWIWNDFLLPLIILQSKNLRTIQLAQYSFFGAYKREYGKALASLVLSATPIIIFYLFMQKYIIKGITAGAIKG